MKTRIVSLTLFALFAAHLQSAHAQSKKTGKNKLPNIVWITCEDMGPHLGCYGDSFATTPNLDKFAKDALLYKTCWSNAPVCAPARTTIISGMYPTSTGAHHMRSQTRLPNNMQMFPALLRMLGYYCTNRVKTDYNLVAPQGLWNESSKKAHWKNRPKGRPFFAVFNIVITHESRIRDPKYKPKHDVSKVPIPAYHPDTPEVRRDWAHYYDRITQMDKMVGDLLRELEDAGLLENTIIFYYSDHGSGMPRSKRFPYNSGLHVPLIVRVPQRFRHLAPRDYQPGGRTDRLVSFVDLPATVLSIAGMRPPEFYQGHAFLGKFMTEPQPFIYGFRGRMDERYDNVRSVRDQRYVYLRNFMPHKIYGQHVAYMFQTPTTRVWKKLFDLGKLNKAQSIFWKTKAPEELYDLQNDSDEVHNLANSPKHQEILKRFRAALKKHIFRVRDVGLLPENEIHSRAKGSTPYEMGHNAKKYPLERIFAIAELATSLNTEAVPKLLKGMTDNDSAVRYWAAMGLQMRGKTTVLQNRFVLQKALYDKAASVRIAAAEALGLYGSEELAKLALAPLLKLADPRENDVHVAVMALNALDAMGKKVEPVIDTIRSWPVNVKKSSDKRSNYGVPRLITSIKSRFEQK